VIETPRRVDGAVDRFSCRRGPAFDSMDDVAAGAVRVIEYIDDTRRAKRSRIERLSAGRGIERRAVETDERPPIGLRDRFNAGRKCARR